MFFWLGREEYQEGTYKMSFVLVGTNHKHSPVNVRERICFPRKRLKDTLNFLRESDVLKGAVILSTCNRVEIYASAEDAKAGISEIENFISRYHEIKNKFFLPYFYKYTDRQALKHLFAVSCGLDSLILGETQILSQVKDAFLEAEDIGFIDNFLRRAFSQALSFAKKIHSQTKVSEGKVSVGSVAIDFIKEKSGSLSGKNILIIGVGKVTELVLKYLRREDPNVIFISNRTYEKAKELATQVEAKVIRFDNLKQHLCQADIVISATASPHFIIKKECFGKGFTGKLIIVDLAVPRDVDPDVNNIKGVELFDLESLDSVIKQNQLKRKTESAKAKELVKIEVERSWKKFTESEPELVLLP